MQIDENKLAGLHTASELLDHKYGPQELKVATLSRKRHAPTTMV